MPSKYDVETGLEMLGGGLGGGVLGSTLADTFLGSTVGWGLGGAVGLGSMTMSLAGRHARRKAYKKNKAAINLAHQLNSARLARTHAMQRQALSSGQKGIGGGHMVGGEIEEGVAGATGATGITGPSRAGTVQRQAVGQQKEIAGLEIEAEKAAYRAAKARNKAAQGKGGSRSALESILGIGMAIAGMLGEAKPKLAPGAGFPAHGGWDEYKVPFGGANW